MVEPLEIDNLDIPDYPPPRCSHSERGHHFVKILGNIWRCKHCWRAKWQPSYLEDAIKFSNEIEKYGLQKAYKKRLEQMPKIREIIQKLDEIRMMRELMPEEELVKVVVAIIEINQEPVPCPRPALDKSYYKPHPRGMAVPAFT